MSTTIQNWYNFVLQQMAAESYLNDWMILNQDERMIRLNLGSNNPDYLKLAQTSTTPESKGSASHLVFPNHATSPTH